MIYGSAEAYVIKVEGNNNWQTLIQKAKQIETH